MKYLDISLSDAPVPTSSSHNIGEWSDGNYRVPVNALSTSDIQALIDKEELRRRTLAQPFEHCMLRAEDIATLIDCLKR